MVYERFVKQLDGCTYHPPGENCTCACEAMWLYRASQGRIITSSCDVRRRTGDDEGGTRLEQVEAVSKQYGITTGIVYKPMLISKLWSLMDTGRYGAILQIDYSPIAPTQYDCFDSHFFGAHAIYLTRPSGASSVVAGDPGADGRRSTIPKGWQTYPRSLLTKAAGMLDIGDAGHPLTLDSRYGAGHCFAYVTPPDPAGVKYLATISGPVSIYNRPGGTVVGRVTKATYICTRSKIDGLWWYTILTTSSGGATSLRGKAFKPNRYVEAHAI
jgi:hypothetical protein